MLCIARSWANNFFGNECKLIRDSLTFYLYVNGECENRIVNRCEYIVLSFKTDSRDISSDAYTIKMLRTQRFTQFVSYFFVIFKFSTHFILPQHLNDSRYFQ